jgi:ribosomal protein uL24
VALSATLSKELQTAHGIKRLPIRRDDEVQIFRRKFNSRNGKVTAMKLRSMRINGESVTICESIREIERKEFSSVSDSEISLILLWDSRTNLERCLRKSAKRHFMEMECQHSGKKTGTGQDDLKSHCFDHSFGAKLELRMAA